MVVDIRRHLTEMAQDLGKGSLPGDEDLTDCHHDHPHLSITTAMENRFWMLIGTGHHETEDLVAQEGAQEGVVLAVEATSTPTSRAIRESVWTDTNETVVETGEHEADRRLPEEGSGIITGTADRLAVGRAPLVKEMIKGGHILMNEAQKIWINLLPFRGLRSANTEIVVIGKPDLGIDIKLLAQVTISTMAASVIVMRDDHKHQRRRS